MSTSVRPGPVPAARPRAPGWHGPPAPETGLDVKTWVRFPGDPKLSRHRCLWMWRVCGVLCAVGARGRQCCLSADLNSLTTPEKQLTGRSCALKRACGNRQSLTVIAPLCSGGRGSERSQDLWDGPHPGDVGPLALGGDFRAVGGCGQVPQTLRGAGGWGQGLHPAGFRVLASRMGGWGAPRSLGSAPRPLTHAPGPLQGFRKRRQS